MKAYIDKAVALEALRKGGVSCNMRAHNIVASIPAADVVEVIRCKNCFYYKPFGECNNTGATVKPDDYCSYGARMDKED